MPKVPSLTPPPPPRPQRPPPPPPPGGVRPEVPEDLVAQQRISGSDWPALPWVHVSTEPQHRQSTADMPPAGSLSAKERTFKHVINGEVVELERKRPALTDDAVPTIFPDAPLYFTKHVRKRRKERELANRYAQPPKRMALDEGMPDSELTESVDVQSASETSDHLFSIISPPSAFCTEIVLTNEPGELCFGWHIRGEKCRDVLVHKHVLGTDGCSETTQEQAETSLCRIYSRNVKVDEFFVATESDALAALKKADALFLCPGCGIEPIKTGQCTKFGESYYSHACSVTTAEGKQCLRCKYTRKLISNQMCRQKQNPKPKFPQRAARQSVQLLRTRTKLAKAQETVEKLRLVNQSEADTAFEQKICGLPPKQQLAVRTCFNPFGPGGVN
ncbi:hypothetical protein HPB51_004673 [Rhipicephalus microplus]|uniref:Uncharacterized protein n=1 Tax=Rhipicephalus microplus TaxID=6941 RepID=A0A9J6EWS2_RHIMP|nr:hypothetical protein HPB51_004673 [Rhipicephalus microplus]